MLRRQKPKPVKIPDGLTLHPEISRILNSCRGNDEECRILVRPDNASDQDVAKTELLEDARRLTIVVDSKGRKIKTYYG